MALIMRFCDGNRDGVDLGARVQERTLTFSTTSGNDFAPHHWVLSGPSINPSSGRASRWNASPSHLVATPSPSPPPSPLALALATRIIAIYSRVTLHFRRAAGDAPTRETETLGNRCSYATQLASLYSSNVRKGTFAERAGGCQGLRPPSTSLCPSWAQSRCRRASRAVLPSEESRLLYPKPGRAGSCATSQGFILLAAPLY